MQTHEENIQDFVNKRTEPVDVEKLRVACKIGNWNTALKHCLDLLIQGKIQGQKTSKGWIFFSNQKVHLQQWQEAVGTLENIDNGETEATAHITFTYKKEMAIALPKNDPETQKLLQLIGKKVSILRTDEQDRPFIVRSEQEIHCTNPGLPTKIVVGIGGFVQCLGLFKPVSIRLKRCS